MRRRKSIDFSRTVHLKKNFFMVLCFLTFCMWLLFVNDFKFDDHFEIDFTAAGGDVADFDVAGEA